MVSCLMICAGCQLCCLLAKVMGRLVWSYSHNDNIKIPKNIKVEQVPMLKCFTRLCLCRVIIPLAYTGYVLPLIKSRVSVRVD